MNDYEQKRMISLLGLRAFSRSIGMIAGAIALLLTRDPYNALGYFIGVWLVSFIIKSILPSSIVDMNFWTCCSLPVNVIGAYPIRWFIYIVLVIIALVIGAPLGDTLIIMGGIFLVDLTIVLFRGS